jgi:hypothetical protein
MSEIRHVHPCSGTHAHTESTGTGEASDHASAGLEAEHHVDVDLSFEPAGLCF